MHRRQLGWGLLGLGLLASSGIRARLTFGLLPDRLTVIFDGSCGFCTRSARLVKALDHQDRLTIVPFQQAGVPADYGLTTDQCEAAAWAVTPDGVPYPAAAAINLTLATALRTAAPLWLYAVPGLTTFQEFAYRLLAANRHLLPGDQPYCDQHPEACQQLIASEHRA